MPSYAKESQRYHLDRVRSALFIKPNAGRQTIQHILEQDPHDPLHLQDKYIDKLLRKIQKERAHRQHKKVVAEIAIIEDEFERLREEAIRILFTASSSNVKIRAIAQIWNMRVELYNAKLDAGIFERHIGKVETSPYIMTPEDEALLKRALGYAIRSCKRPETPQEKNP